MILPPPLHLLGPVAGTVDNLAREFRKIRDELLDADLVDGAAGLGTFALGVA